MHGNLINAAVIGYIVATGLALAYLVQRQDLVHRLAVLATLAGWAAHSGALIARAIELGAPPLGQPARRDLGRRVGHRPRRGPDRATHGCAGARRLRPADRRGPEPEGRRLRAPSRWSPALASAWIWIHIGLALIGIAAFVFNFAGALMYLLQERQLKAKRPGAFYYSAAGAGDARSPDLPHARARLSVPDHRPRPGRPVGAERVGQRLHLRPAGASSRSWPG